MPAHRINRDLTGTRSGKLIVLGQEVKRHNGLMMTMCRCQCDCGNVVEIPASRITAKKPQKSCGCLRAAKDLTGQRFGRLFALEELPERTAKGERVWRCLCDCGNYHTATASQLTRGTVRSCGCALREAQNRIGEQTMLGVAASHTPDAERRRIESRTYTQEQREETGTRLDAELRRTKARIYGTNAPVIMATEPSSQNTSGYRNVFFSRDKNKWGYSFQIRGRIWRRIAFRTPEKAKEECDEVRAQVLANDDLVQAAIAERTEYEKSRKQTDDTSQIKK